MQLRQLSAGVTGLALGLLLNVASNWLSGAGAALVPVIVAIFVGTLSVSIYLWWRNPTRVGLNIRPVRTLRAEAEKRQQAHRGLIAFVSLYRPGRDSRASKKPEDWQAAAARNDYQALDLPHSNLATTIEAIMSHTSQLEHCWLIGTTATDLGVPGSSIYIPALIEYLRHERGLKCTFHHGPECNLPLDDDALVFTKTLDLVRHVFAQAEKEGEVGLQAQEVIADFTGGTRSMTLGMILACLDGDRDIEMIGTHYDAAGNPKGPIFPIIFSFEPVLLQT
jgi:hypothetical protein